jgi:septum formation inhibitor-activating ATPase MinD
MVGGVTAMTKEMIKDKRIAVVIDEINAISNPKFQTKVELADQLEWVVNKLAGLAEVGYDIILISSQAGVYWTLAKYPGIREDKFKVVKVGTPTEEDVRNIAKSKGIKDVD